MRATLLLAGAAGRDALRGPVPWVVAGIGCLALWAGVSLEILALRSESRALELGVATAEGVALLVAVLACVRAVDLDASSGYGEALDGGAAGATSRLTGRFLGAVAVGLLAAVPALALSVALYNYADGGAGLGWRWIPDLALEVAATGAWALLLARVLPPSGATLGAIAVLVLARAGPPSALAALLPRPLDPARAASLAALAGQAAAAAAATLAAVSVRGREASA